MLNLKKGLTATQLKYLACFLMFLDHIHEMFAFQGAPLWLTMLGRLVFPIFLFLSADSFYYTRNRKAYMTRLLAGSCFMVAMTALVTAIFPNDRLGLINNAFSTFFMVGIYILVYEWIKKGIQEKKASWVFKGIGLALLPVLSGVIFMLLVQPLYSHLPFAVARILAMFLSMIPNILLVEGGFFMVALGVVFYIFRTNRPAQMLALILLSIFSFFVDKGSVQWMMVFALIPMALYNGQEGKGMKWFFYIFYPLHIYGLYILSVLLF